MWISGVLLVFQLLNLVAAQGDPEFKHELPPGTEVTIIVAIFHEKTKASKSL